jgi:phosphoesterase RecJ-like protein
MKKKVQVFIEKIKNAKSIAISGHKNLDGDALCSALALMKIIELNFGKKATVIYDGNVPRELDNVPLRKEAVFYKNLPENSNYDLYILVDYGTRKHLGGAEKYIDAADFVIEIDHHFNDDLVGDLCFDYEEKAATSQIVYDIVKAADFDIDQDIVDLLMLAIITDTGNFKFVRHSDVFKDAAKLLEAGADIPRLVNLLNNKDKKTVLVESKVVSEAEFFMKGRLALATINHEDYKKLDGRGEIVLSLLAQIHGVQYVVLLKEHKENLIGVSIRSREKPINQIAESLGGGGHMCAAGAVIEDGLQNVRDKIINAFKGM